MATVTSPQEHVQDTTKIAPPSRELRPVIAAIVRRDFSN